MKLLIIESMIWIEKEKEGTGNGKVYLGKLKIEMSVAESE
jgi:hypothetical protein